MLQVIPKWKVTVTVAGVAQVLWVYANSVSDVMRKLADIQFTENGLTQPTSVHIQGGGPVIGTAQVTTVHRTSLP